MAVQYHNVILFGAGASFDAGIPMLDSFVDKMWEYGFRRKVGDIPLSPIDIEILSKANDIVLGNIAGTRVACPAIAGTPSAACTGFYYALPAAFAFPAEIAAFGVAYTRGTTSALSTPPTTATRIITPTAASHGEMRGRKPPFSMVG